MLFSHPNHAFYLTMDGVMWNNVLVIVKFEWEITNFFVSSCYFQRELLMICDSRERQVSHFVKKGSSLC